MFRPSLRHVPLWSVSGEPDPCRIRDRSCLACSKAEETYKDTHSRRAPKERSRILPLWKIRTILELTIQLGYNKILHCSDSRPDEGESYAHVLHSFSSRFTDTCEHAFGFVCGDRVCGVGGACVRGRVGDCARFSAYYSSYALGGSI
jgi:hypothetical protein